MIDDKVSQIFHACGTDKSVCRRRMNSKEMHINRQIRIFSFSLNIKRDITNMTRPSDVTISWIFVVRVSNSKFNETAKKNRRSSFRGTIVKEGLRSSNPSQSQSRTKFFNCFFSTISFYGIFKYLAEYLYI